MTVNYKKEIREQHWALLRRDPMGAELDYWLQHFRAGGTLARMKQEIMASHEYAYEQNLARKNKGGAAHAVAGLSLVG